MIYHNPYVHHAEIELDDDFDNAISVVEDIIEGRIKTTMPLVLSFGGIRLKIRTNDELYVALGMLNAATNIHERLIGDFNAL